MCEIPYFFLCFDWRVSFLYSFGLDMDLILACSGSARTFIFLVDVDIFYSILGGYRYFRYIHNRGWENYSPQPRTWNHRVGI